MNEFKSFRQRMVTWHMSDFARIAIVFYLMVMANAIANNPDNAVTQFVRDHFLFVRIEISTQVFLFNLSFLMAGATYALVDRTSVLVIWLLWPLIFNAMSVWQIIQDAGIDAHVSTHHAVNGAFVFILLFAVIILTEIAEQRQAVLLQRVVNHEHDCNERVAAAVAAAIQEQAKS